MKDVPESFERKMEKVKVHIELLKKRNKRERDRKRGRINRIIQTADGTAITSEHQQGSVNTLYSISSLGRAGYCVCMCVWWAILSALSLQMLSSNMQHKALTLADMQVLGRFPFVKVYEVSWPCIWHVLRVFSSIFIRRTDLKAKALCLPI